MDDFPDFMKTPANAIASASQSKGVKGWLYESVDDKQMAYWICEADGKSAEHVHDYDEYFVVLQGQYSLIIDNKSIQLTKGDEYLIPQGVPHAGAFIAGTRTIHFGGRRVFLSNILTIQAYSFTGYNAEMQRSLSQQWIGDKK